MDNEHSETVRAISARVKHFAAAKRPFRIYHGSTNSTRGSQRRPDNTVDTSSLNRVLDVDIEKKTALVEPNVPMDTLVAATVAKGLVPLVVMEFPGITAGGGFSGTSGESSSFRYGPFDATVNWIEIVLGTGELVRASRITDDKTDLFWGAASAFGTLGVVTLLEVQLQDAMPFVRLSYTLQGTVQGSMRQIRDEIARDDADYVDAIMFSKTATVVCSGDYIKEPPVSAVISRFTRSYDPWFYVHVRRMLQRLAEAPDATITEYVPLVDYLFRYDRGGFWVAKYSFDYFLVPFNRITRFVLNPFMHTRTMYRALHKSGLADFYMVQDVGVPYDKVDEFVDWLESTLGIYPLWLCPLLLARSSLNAEHGLHSNFARLNKDTSEGRLMNFGVWGPLPSGLSDQSAFVQGNRLLEQKVQELGGKKWLYAHAYYTEDEFWAHYDRQSYDRVRAKYGAEWLPTVYDKVKVEEKQDAAARGLVAWLLAWFWAIWPMRGLYGVVMAILGGDYLMASAATAQTKVLKQS
ncbi:fad binding domain protein [Ophiostoma piceae UAMH 11346]|uniref:Delta(24)-sterol reductase n=1 Tax=Ophiostoma piceae (strain UAMH 11346) TaxID=1262450 RepID=S3BMN9_OPHP1|nr:fad binding domain protein [Ophiostoma piceae UAMH 11346]